MMIRWSVGLCVVLQLAACFLVNPGEPKLGETLIVDGGPDAVSVPECSGAGCTAEVVADLQPQPGALASDNVDLFWSNAGTPDDLGNLRNGAIMARPLSGGEVRVVVPGQSGQMLAVLNDYLYWKSGFRLWRAPKDGSADKAIVYESSESIWWMEFSLTDTAIVVLDSVGGDARIITIDPDDLSQSAFTIRSSRRAWSLSVSNQSAYTLTGNESSAERELLAISLVDQNYSVLSTENEHYTSVASEDTSWA